MTRVLLPSLLALSLAACGGHDAATPKPAPHTDARGDLRYGSVVFKPCALGGEFGRAVEAECAKFDVPENHDAPAGRKITLAVAMIPAKKQALPDPVVIIAGGPGQSILDSYPMLDDALSDLRNTRNILLVDARGTGDSHPLECRNSEGRNAVTEENDDSPESARAFAERCRDTLSKTSDLRFYGTGDHIRDLDALRAAVGADQLNLIGISYGTRVAQQYAMHFPAHARTVVLDSVVPNTLVLGQEHARNLDDALATQFARCRAEPACRDHLGDPAATMKTLRERLKAGGLAPVRYRDPTSGDWREEAPTYGHLAVLLRMYAYQPQAASILPWIVHEAAEGRYESLLAQSRLVYGDVSEAMMHGMELSVICTEDPEIAVDPKDADTVIGNEFVAFQQAQCAVWPKGKRAADFRKPLAGDVPLLAMSGEYDPVTPPRYGDEVVKTLPNGRHLLAPGQGHNVIATGCMPKLVAQFVEKADAKSLDAGCLKRLKPSPPFAGNYGWEP